MKNNRTTNFAFKFLMKVSVILTKCVLIEMFHSVLDIMYNISIMKIKMDKDEKCNCLPTCESAAYFSEGSRGILDSSYCTSQFSI